MPNANAPSDNVGVCCRFIFAHHCGARSLKILEKIYP
jgi:hypothetical protein